MTASDKMAGRIIGPPKTKAATLLPHHERMQKLSCGLAASSLLSSLAADRRRPDEPLLNAVPHDKCFGPINMRQELAHIAP
jgi:hypothetical protein